MKTKLTFFQMMYCWMFVYLSYFKYKRDSPENFSCAMLSICRVTNFICISTLLNFLFDFSRFGKGPLSPFMLTNIIIFAIIFIGDDFLFFRRRNKLLGIFMDYPQKQKLRGRRNFWIYIAVTLTTFGLIILLGQVVEKPILAI